MDQVLTAERRDEKFVIDEAEDRLLVALEDGAPVAFRADDQVAGFMVEDHPAEVEQLVGGTTCPFDHLGSGD
jgi:hypothetical protein